MIELFIETTFHNSEIESLSSEEVKKVGGLERKIRDNVYSKVESTGVTTRDQLRRKLVKLLRDSITLESFQALRPDLTDKLLKNAFELERRWATECALRLEDYLYSLSKCGKPY